MATGQHFNNDTENYGYQVSFVTRRGDSPVSPPQLQHYDEVQMIRARNGRNAAGDRNNLKRLR